jgi:hypothetical protein
MYAIVEVNPFVTHSHVLRHTHEIAINVYAREVIRCNK